MPYAPQKEFGASTESDADELKRVLLEGNPYFLAVTFAVSILHSLFDVLAFKNDIGFWRNKKSVEGLSVRTVVINCFCQVRTLDLLLTRILLVLSWLLPGSSLGIRVHVPALLCTC
jgi:hypothetical protein